MARITKQNYTKARNGFGKASTLCDTGTAPGNVIMCGYGPDADAPQRPRLTFILYSGECGTGGAFKVALTEAECVKLASIMLGDTMRDVRDQARAVLAKIKK
jgi:hypothetical protein